MNFSLLLPTRKRPQQLRLLVESIKETASTMVKTEILFGIDNDDSESIKTVHRLMLENKSCHFHMKTRNRGNSLVSHYTNWLAEFATGKYIMLLNDDCLFRTKDWDIKVWNRLENFIKDKPDGIVCGICQNLGHPTRTGYLACGFPIISKKAVEVVGSFYDPSFMDVTADDDACKLYALVGRSVDLRDIFEVEHNPVEFDGLDKKYNSITEKNYVDIIERPWLPTDLKELRFYFDERIPKLVNHMIEGNK